MKKYSFEEANQKILRYCAYQERAHQEVRNKLYEFGLSTADVDSIIVHLITEGFLNEERFAKSFAGGKFRIKKWGRIKIVHALESKGLTKNCIQSGLKEIDSGEYEETLRELLEKKKSELRDVNVFAARDKLSKFVMLKGFEPDLVWKVLKEILPD